MRPCDDLLEMVAGVNLVKASPLLRGERTEDGMPKQAYLRAEPLLGVRERRVHGDESVIEVAKWFVFAQAAFRFGLLGRFNTLWEASDLQYIKTANAFRHSRTGPVDLAGIHSPQEALGRGGVAEEEMLENLQGIPMSPRRALPSVGRYSPGRTLGFSAHDFQFWRHSLHPAR